MRHGLWVFAISALMAAFPLRAVDPPSHRVLVVPFVNHTGEKSLYWIGEAFAIGLTDHLLAAGVESVEPERRREAQEAAGLGTAAAPVLASTVLLAEKLGVDQALVGEIEMARGNRITITGRRVKVKASALGKTVTVSGALNDLYEIQKRFAVAIMPEIQGRTGWSQIPPLEENLDVPLSSYELYVKAMVTTDPEERERFLDLALKDDPLFSAALMARARLDLDEGHVQQALNRLDGVPVARMAFPERLWLVRGDAVAASGDRGSAADLYRRILHRRPLPEAYFRLAAVLAQQGKLLEARRQLQAGLQLDPLHPEGIELHEALARHEDPPS